MRGEIESALESHERTERDDFLGGPVAEKRGALCWERLVDAASRS
jgi:hypothetical protein